MTQEDKQLLLKDLCARLPYGVIVDYKENEFEIPHWKITTIYPETMDGWIGYNEKVGVGSKSGSRHFKIGEVKPYLRTMSSMTEEEVKEFYDVECIDAKVAYIKPTWNWHFTINGIDWLNAHHFDYRGLITKCLAIKVTKENNSYKK